MGWSLGYDSTWQRDIGYGVPAYCDHPKCDAKINRGLGYVCGDDPYGGDVGCGLYFCEKHRRGWRKSHNVCSRCANRKAAYAAKFDHPQWVRHKLNDPSWGPWRAENDREVKGMRAYLALQAHLDPNPSPSAQQRTQDDV